MKKEYFYVGHYSKDGAYYLKIGTTNNLERRRKEHTHNYGVPFQYDFYLPLSKYNTLRIEDRTRQTLIDLGYAYVPNDRFRFEDNPPKEIVVKVRKEYHIELGEEAIV